MDTVSLEEIVTEESIDSKIAQEESKDATVDPIIEIYAESNHTEESHVETIQDADHGTSNHLESNGSGCSKPSRRQIGMV